MPYIFTDYNQMVGKKPRQLYWKELHDAVNDIDDRLYAMANVVTEPKPATLPIHSYHTGVTTFSVNETASSGYPTLIGVVETVYVTPTENIQHFFSTEDPEVPEIYFRRWNEDLGRWTNWNKLLTDFDQAKVIGHISDDERHITDADRRKMDGYRHQQITPSDVWNIDHAMGKYPSVTIVDSAGSVVVGKVTYQTENLIQVRFSAPFSGTAICS